MAICEACGQDMYDVDGCTVDMVDFPIGSSSPSDRYHFDEPSGRCHDCFAKHGELHHPGCDVERCPRCGGQLISCGCLDEE